MERVGLRCHGRTEVEGLDGDELRPKERAVLAALAMEHPDPVTTERLARLMWGEDQPATAHKSIHNHLTRLRRVLPDAVVTGPDGYRLAPHLRPDALDPADALAAPAEEGASSEALARLLEVTDGLLFAELAPGAELTERRSRHDEIRAALEERYVEALLGERRDDAAVPAARRLVDLAPDSEHRWWLLVMALARTGRRREALAAVAAARRRLVDSGLELGFELRHLETLVAAGDPVLAGAPVLRRTNPPGMVGPAGDPIGVDDLLRDLEGWLGDGARDAVMTVIGPAGSGKSTVAGAVVDAARRRGMTVVVAACDPEPSAPLQPVVEVLEAMAVRHPDAFTRDDMAGLEVLSPELASHVTRPVAGPVTGDLVDAVARAFEVAPVDPTLVVFEDVHWASPLTVQAVRAAARGVASAPSVRLLLTTRPREGSGADDGELWSDVGESVAVDPWTPDDVARWLGPLEPDEERRRAAARWLHAQSGGRPLFVRELTSALLAQGLLGRGVSGEFRAPEDAPPAVMTALAARLERLAPPVQQTAEVAGVVGSRLSRSLLISIPGVSAGTVDDLVRSRVLLPIGGDPESLMFEHELLRRAAVERLSPAAAAEVHHLVLAALDGAGGETAAVRAHHAVAAAALDVGRAVAAADRAAEDAAAALDHGGAGWWWLVAAQVLAERRPEAHADRLERQVMAGEALLRIGDPRSEEILLRAASQAADLQRWDQAAHAAAAVCRLGPTSMAGRPHPEAAALCDHLLDRITSPGVRASLAAATTVVHSLAGAVDRCRDLFQQAVADAAADGSDEAWIDVLPNAYMSLSDPADLEERELHTDHLERVSRRAGRVDGELSALHLRFSNQLQRGDPALRETAAAMAEMADRVRARQRDWEIGYVRSTVAFVDGDLGRAEQAITETLSFVDTVAESRVMAVFGVHLLALRFVQHRLGELVDTIAALAEEQPTVGAWRAALALAAAEGGRPALARTAFDGVLAEGEPGLARDFTYTGGLVALAEAAASLGDPVRAAKVEPLLAPWSGRWSWVGTCTLGPIDNSLARVVALSGDRERAEALADRALASCERLGAPVFARRARASFPTPAS